jgi:hypothetical protein
MLATATGPAWLIARRLGLSAAWAAPAALTATLPALVYGYELLGSIKELTALAMILSLGALLAAHPRWLRGAPTGAIPFALVLAAGASALGAGFGAWALAPTAILLVVLIGDVRSARQGTRHALLLVAAGALTVLVAAWPTWVDLTGSLHVAQTIATTSNPGNLHAPLRFIQVFGVWLRGSYKQSPTGAELQLTYVLVGLTAAAAVLGAVHLIRRRDHALAAWFALMLVVYFALTRYSTAWVGGKGLMLTSPVVLLLAWGGVAALRAPAAWPRLAYAAPVLALAIAAGVLASDLAQYHSSNLAPTARYQELADINKRFAGRGPTLFTDFDEWALYQLRDLDIGGPNFVYPPTALRTLARGYGYPVDLDRAPPAALRAYPLIITRTNPTASPPPAAYGLLWRGAYYQVWARLPGAPAAIAHYGAAPASPLSCTRVQGLARLARGRAAKLLAAASPELVPVSLAGARHPASWGHQRNGLVMRAAGRLTAAFTVPASGEWDLWLQGQIMPAVSVRVDGRPLATLADELGGNSLIPDPAPPVRVRLSAGSHHVSVTRGGFTLAPGDGGSAVLDGIFLTPARGSVREVLSLPPGGGRSLCARNYYWIDVVPAHAVA